LLPAYRDDNNEVLDFSVSLLIRPLPKTGYSKAAIGELGLQRDMLDWFGDFDTKLKPSDLVAELNLIDSYELKNREVNFWMEPAEIYRLPVMLEIRPGNYAAMITFIGHRGQFEFWRRFFVIEVNPPRAKSVLQEAAGFLASLVGKKDSESS